MSGPCHTWRRFGLGLGLGLVVVVLTSCHQHTLAAASGSSSSSIENAEFGRLQRRLFDFRESDPYPSHVAFQDLGDWYLENDDPRSALKFFSMGLHLDPFNYELRSRIDTVKQRLGGKKAVSMCKWRGNMFTQTHEISTALGIAHASANRIAESLVFFFSSVERSFKDALTAHSNLAVSMYRMGNAERSNAKKKRSLMTTAYHAIHHNVEKLDSNNHAILNYMDQWFANLPAKEQAIVKKKKIVSPKVAVCGKSSAYSYAAYNFIEGMLMMRGGRMHEAEIMLRASYTAEPDSTTAAALAWVSFRREKPEAGLEWIDRCTQSSPTQRDLARLDWQEISPGTSTATRIEEEDPVYNLSDDPEAHRSIAHVAGAGGNVEAWREFLGTWWKRQRLELAKLRDGSDHVLQTVEGVQNARFLIGYLPDVGLGNQVTSLISYVVMAMLMDRALLLYWPEALDHNFRNLQDSVQLQLQNWVLEDSAPFVRLDLAVRYSQSLVFMEDAYAQDTDFFQTLVCGDLKEYAQAPFVYTLTNQNLFRMLEANPIYEEKLRSVFGENLFGILTTWLIKPRPHIQSFVDRYVEKFFQAEAKGFSAGGEGPPYHVIGVHMRSGMQENSQDVKILYVNNREPVYEGLVDNIEAIVAREKAIVSAEAGNGQEAPRIIVFMAVDNEPLKRRASSWLRQRLGSSAVVSAEDGRKSLNSSLGMRIERHSTEGMAGAVIDMLILSRCNAVVRVGKALSLFTSLAASQMKDARSRVYYAPPTGQCAEGRQPNPLYGVAFSGQQSRIAINEGVVMEHNMLRCWGKGPMEVVRHLDNREWLYPSCHSVVRNFTHPDLLKGKLPQLLPPRPRA